MVAYNFRNEIDLLYTDEFKEFVDRAFDRVPIMQYAEMDVKLTKRIFKFAKFMLTTVDADDVSSDLVLSAVLLHAICRYDMVEGVREEDEMHQFHVRKYLLDLGVIIGRENFHNLMLLIESQKGFDSPIPQVMPKIDDAIHVWILPLSIGIAKQEVEDGEDS